MGSKHSIIITQKEISGREIVEVEFKGEKIKEHLGGIDGDMNLMREIWERTLGNEINGRENMGLQNWGDIEEK